MKALSSLGICAAALFSISVAAQDAANFPSKPLTLVMPYLPGSTSDRLARVFQDGLTQELKQTVLVDYKPGASGMIANSYVIKSGADGHVFSFTAATAAILPAFKKDMPYDLLKDMSPVSLMLKDTYVLVVPPSLPVNTYEEYVAYARANPGAINWSTVGAGGALHLSGEWLAKAIGAKFTFVHYKGSATAEVDLLAGRIQSSPKGLASALPIIRSGKVKAIAVLTADRTALLPGLRTVAEMGVPGFEHPGWIAILGSGATPPAIVAKLSAALGRAVKLPKAMQLWESVAVNPVGSTPEEFRQVLTREMAHWKKFVDENNIKAEDE